MTHTDAVSGRKVSMWLWGVACIAGCGALGFLLDHQFARTNTGFYGTIGLMLGVTASTYLDERAGNRPLWWTGIGAFVVLWYLGLQIFFSP